MSSAHTARGYALALALLSAPAQAEQTVSGAARVLDGDTIVVNGTHVRLKGVDAAEKGTALGENARRALIAIVPSALICELTGEKTWGREVGYCRTPAGLDIGREIIRIGAALACPRYSTLYLNDERPEARAAQPRASYCLRRR